MPLVARLAFALAVALGAAGCAASLKEAQLDPAVRQKLGEGPPIRVVHGVPKPLDLVRSALEPRDVYHEVPGVEDPVADVERAFVDALRGELGWSNLYPSDRPMTGSPAEWGNFELLLSLDTLHWYIDGSGLKRLLGRCTLLFALRAKLVRLSDRGAYLWQGICSSEHPRRCSELVADDLQGVRELRAEVAKRCAADLMGSFMGRTETTFWGGVNQPKQAPK